MPNLHHPVTGQHARASLATAARLLEEGWEEITRSSDTAPAAAKKTEPKSDSKPKVEPSPPGGDSKPLDKMKLTELIEHAEKIGVDAEQIDSLRKPGASKAKALEIIAAHTGA